jgi:Domain of unknown function (DUF4129)
VRLGIRNALGDGARRGASRTLLLSLPLVVLVIAAAGLAGTARFSGPRWYPHISAAKHRVTTTPPQAKLKGEPIRTSSSHGSFGLPSWLPIALIVALALGIAALIWRWWRGRPTPAAATVHAPTVGITRVAPPQPEPEPEALLTGIELALQVFDEQREPADAVVRAWVGLEETAEESGIVRGPSETPTEFTVRILRGVLADDRAILTLLRLYLRTRFGDHPVTAEEVADVRDALQRLVASWRVVHGATMITGR